MIAGTVAQRIIDQLEPVKIAEHDGKAGLVPVGMRKGLRYSIIEQYPIGQASQHIMCGQMAQLAIGGLQTLGAGRNILLEGSHLRANHPLIAPFAGQRVGALKYFDRLERLSQHQQLIGVPQPLHDLHPVVVGVRRADHDLDMRIDRPEALDGFKAVPAGRHPHIDECHAVWASLCQRLSRLLDALLSLVRRVNREHRAGRSGFDRFAE